MVTAFPYFPVECFYSQAPGYMLECVGVTKLSPFAILSKEIAGEGDCNNFQITECSIHKSSIVPPSPQVQHATNIPTVCQALCYSPDVWGSHSVTAI